MSNAEYLSEEVCVVASCVQCAAPDWSAAIERVRSGGVPEWNEQRVLVNGLRILLRGRSPEQVRVISAEVLLRVWLRVRRGELQTAQELAAAARAELRSVLPQ